MMGLYNNNANNNNDDDLLKLQQGIMCNKLFMYTKNNYLYLVKDKIRMFCVSFKRLKKTISFPMNYIFSIIVKNPDNVYLETKIDNPNKFILVIKYTNAHRNAIFTRGIKLKEIDNYLEIAENENPNLIIDKQYEKINILLKKLEYYENKYPEVLTDEEFL